jgi:8-oxo-dGTP pyrophosphatase MutT (NUDIX family)
MNFSIFSEIARHLPRIAEEGPDREMVAEAALIDGISRAAGSRELASGVISVVRQQFLALALLDEERLAEGLWQFVSFPASLCARSLLAGLADPGFRFLEKGFWESSEFRIDRQRALLRDLESQRRAASATSPPIRRVWVSWAIMASDGKFLMVRREDSREERAGSRGRFVFPGGKVSASDLAGLSIEKRLAFFDPTLTTEPGAAGEFLVATLVREIDEELELDSGSIESAVPLSPPIHYTALEGAGSAHSLTEYFIQPFHVEITDSGKEKLLRALERHADRFSWFDSGELAEGKNSLNQTAFVDALRELDEKSTAAVMDAGRSDVRFSIDLPLTDTVDVPRFVAEPFLIGTTGRERACLASLDEQALADVAFLAALRRGDPVRDLSGSVATVPHLGWLIVDDDRLLQHLRELSTRLRASAPDFPLLTTSGRAVRFNSSDPSLVNFSGGWMTLTAEDERRGKNYRLRIERHEIASRLGVASPVTHEARVSGRLGESIYGLVNNDATVALENLETIKRVQRIELKSLLASVGLRLLIRQVEGVPELTVRRN